MGHRGLSDRSTVRSHFDNFASVSAQTLSLDGQSNQLAWDVGGWEILRRKHWQNLKKCFEQFKASKKNLPRPVTRVPIQFAASTRVNLHAKLAKDFTKRVLGVEWAWISDESSLSDFSSEVTDDSLVQQIRAVYGVDVSDISSGNLADILDRIALRADFSA